MTEYSSNQPIRKEWTEKERRVPRPRTSTEACCPALPNAECRSIVRLTSPESSSAGCAEVRLEHLELLNVIDGEVHVVEVLVDGIDHTPDAAHDHGFGHAIDQHEVQRIPACKVPERNGKPSWQLHRHTTATVTGLLLIGHGKGGSEDGEELVK